MRVKKEIDFKAISKRSMQRDYESTRKRIIIPQKALNSQIGAIERVLYICKNSEYAKYARFIVGKLVRLEQKSDINNSAWYCSFVNDCDRKALNKEANWSDSKKIYLFDGVKFKNK